MRSETVGWAPAHHRAPTRSSGGLEPTLRLIAAFTGMRAPFWGSVAARSLCAAVASGNGATSSRTVAAFFASVATCHPHACRFFRHRCRFNRQRCHCEGQRCAKKVRPCRLKRRRCRFDRHRCRFFRHCCSVRWHRGRAACEFERCAGQHKRGAPLSKNKKPHRCGFLRHASQLFLLPLRLFLLTSREKARPEPVEKCPQDG